MKSIPLLVVCALAIVVGACSSEEGPDVVPGEVPGVGGSTQDAATDGSKDGATDGGNDVSVGDTSTTDTTVPDATSEQAADSAVDAAHDASGQDSASQEADAAVTLQPISVEDLHAALANKDFLLINVHVPYAGEIPGTDANIAYNDVDAIATFIGTDMNAKVVLYCLTNMMSVAAGNALIQRGYQSIQYLDGGLAAWQNAGYPVENH